MGQWLMRCGISLAVALGAFFAVGIPTFKLTADDGTTTLIAIAAAIVAGTVFYIKGDRWLSVKR